MYIFRRTSSLKPEHMLDGMAFAVEVAAKVTSITGRDLNVFNTVFGAPIGTIHWTARFESLAELGDVTAKLAVDSGYMDMVQKASGLFSSLPSDSVVNIISSSLTGTAQRYVAITEAVPANGKIAEAVAFGVKTQAHVAKSGRNTAFGTRPFGAYGAVSWVVAGQTLADMDTLQNFFTTDATFQKLVADASDLFVEGSGHNSLLERIN